MKRWQKALLWSGAGVVLVLVALVLYVNGYVWIDGFPVSKKAESCVLSSENITTLEPLRACTELKRVDARGCGLSVDEVRSFVEATGCEVRWSVPIGTERYDSDSHEISCAPGVREVENLSFFPNLEKATLNQCRDYEGLQALLEDGTEYILCYSIEVGDSVIGEADEEAEISGATYAEVAGAMSCLPQLKRVDLRNCNLSVEEVAALQEEFLDRELICRVETEELRADTNAEAVTVLTLTENVGEVLRLFPRLQEVDLRSCAEVEEYLPSLWSAFPGVEFLYQLKLGDTWLTGEETELAIKAGVEFEEAKATLPLMRNLATVDLRQSGYTEAQCRELADLREDVHMSFAMTYCGMQVDTQVEELDFSGTALTAEQVEEELPYLYNLKKLVLCGCGIENEDMGTLREKYPEIQFVWTVMLGPHEVRTDAVSFSTFNRSKHISPADSEELAATKRRTYRLTTEDIAPLQYCTELEGLDLGHNNIDDISVLRYCKKLRYLIMADNFITDISVLEELPELMYVELFMNSIEDVSPLSGLTKLLDLNLCNNKVEDFSPLFTLTQLERLWYWRNPGSDDSRKLIAAGLPDCKCVYDCKGDDTGMGWREHDRYFAMRRLFRTGQE